MTSAKGESARTACKDGVPPFEWATVADAMHAEVLTCPADAPLALVARIMATERVHCVVVEGTEEDRRGWAIVSDLDLVAGASDGLDEGTAGRSAATEFLTVTPDETLARAAQMMVEHQTSHLIVVDPASGRALGVLSSLDVAGAMALGDGSDS
jgi:CBS domain-containing protein